MFRTPVRATLVAATVLSVPAGASAATITPDRACYLTGQGATLPVVSTIAGLGAGQNVTLKLSRKGTVAGSAFGTADAAGNLSLTINSWYANLGSGPHKEVKAQVDAYDDAGNVLGTAPVALASAGVSVTGKGKTRSWKVQGITALTGQSTYYAHYLNHGKYKGRLKLGKAKGACGYLSTKKPLTPFSKLGRYDVTIQSSKNYDAAAPGITGRIVVTKRYR